MKKLPIGISSITAILSEGYVYVDKTALVHSLVSERGRYFLSRPRRFGKSLLVSTIYEIMSGHRDLFNGYAISTMDYDWQSYPVIRLDCSMLTSSSPEALLQSLLKKFTSIAMQYGLEIDTSTLISAIESLVRQLYNSGPVVILVDEYDKPIIDHMDDIPLAIKNRALLKECFTAFKGCDEYIRCIFITGVSKFSQVSVFSGMNNLKDITLHPDYATLLGYTEPELCSFFKEHIARIAQRRGTSPEELVATMRSWYNGYRFSRDGQTVYNPTSAMNFLDTGEFANFWFQTGTPTFLIDMLKQSTEPLQYLEPIPVNSSVFNNHDVDRISPISLLWQTGYLTIESCVAGSDLYTLNYPNEEVRVSFLRHLLGALTDLSDVRMGQTTQACLNALDKQDIDAFFTLLQQLMATMPYDLHIAQEKFYQSILFSYITIMDLSIRAEERTNIGRADLVLEHGNSVYIIECKVNQDVEKAMVQLRQKNYAQKYLRGGRDVFLVGVAFSTEQRNIVAWKHERIPPV